MHSHVELNCSPRRRRARPRLPGASSSTSVDSELPKGPAFRNELFAELTPLSKVVHSFATAYSNGIVERTNQEVMRHLCDDKWSYEQLPMVQRIMNTVEKTSTGVTPVELILNNSIRLPARILAPPGSNTPGSQVALSDTMNKISISSIELKKYKISQQNYRTFSVKGYFNKLNTLISCNLFIFKTQKQTPQIIIKPVF